MSRKQTKTINVKAAKKEIKKAEKAVKQVEKDLTPKKTVSVATKKTVPRSATRVAAAKATPVKVTPKKSKQLANGRRRGIKSVYLESLLNPWKKVDAKIPDMHPYPSSAFQIQYEKLVATDANGICGVLVRADLSRNWAVLSFPGTEMTIDEWEPVPENESILNTFSSFRIVSMGIRLKYQAPPFEAEGRLAAALIPPFNPNPGFGAQAYSWDDVSKLEGAQVVPAIDGVTVLFRPFDNHAFQYRETQMVKALDTSPVTFEKSGYSNPVGDPAVTLMMIQRAWHDSEILDAASTPVPFMAFDGSGLSVQDMITAAPTLGCPFLVVMGDGLPASINAFSCEVVMNVEAISDNRTWSLTQAKLKLSHPNELPTALAVRSHVPDVHQGGSVESHSTFLDGLSGKVSSVTKTIGLGAEIVDGLGALVSAIL